MERIRRVFALSYGVICYAIFFVAFLYLIGFLANSVVPKTIDSGVPGASGWALLVNSALLALFGLQHSVMARPGWKRVMTRVVPPAVERSTYVLASSIVLALMYWLWQPMPDVIFAAESPIAVGGLTALYLAGYGVLLYSTFLIDHFDLFGLRQVFLRAMGKTYTEKRFATPALYKLIRHPLYLGWIVVFWATPSFTVGHLLFASFMTTYIFLAIPLEERDLAAQLGAPYERWREQTPAFIPRFGRKSRPQATTVAREAR
jgi:protein-S-isoprenylcysteine O-methyltransferase Ste14